MSVLRIRIPESATRPTSALMPNGCWNTSKVGMTPMRPSGAVANTIVITDIGDRDAAQEELKLLGHVAGRQADALQPVLIERKAKRGHALAPIGIGRSH